MEKAAFGAAFLLRHRHRALGPLGDHRTVDDGRPTTRFDSPAARRRKSSKPAVLRLPLTSISGGAARFTDPTRPIAVDRALYFSSL